MTNKEAIKIATGLRTDFKCESDTMADFCNTVIEALEQTRWVPVSERLPEPQENGDKDFSDWLLITINLGKDDDTYTGEAYYCFSEKRWYTKRFVIGEVTAWMPQPKPYKPESEG